MKKQKKLRECITCVIDESMKASLVSTKNEDLIKSGMTINDNTEVPK